MTQRLDRRLAAPSQFETLEHRRLMAGQVTVRVEDGDLFIRGDGSANSVVIDQEFTAPGELRITAGDPETVIDDGATEPFPVAFVPLGARGRVFIDMGDGDDTVLVSEVTIRRRLRLLGGSGDDVLTVTRSNVHGTLNIEGDRGDDAINIIDTRVAGNLDVTGGSGDDLIALRGSNIAGDARVFGRSGNDAISRGGCVFASGRVVAVRADRVTEGTVKAYDFRDGAQGWRGKFADYLASQKPTYDLESGIRRLPSNIGSGTGFFLSGDNHSDDLLMYLTRELGPADGIEAGRTYQVQFDIRFASNAVGGGIGVGGSEGDSVYLKAGATPTRPAIIRDEEGIDRLNVDHGQQATSGTAASVVDSIANGLEPAVDVDAPKPYVSLRRSHVHGPLITASADGKLHLIVGTESGYEAVTAIYFQSIRVALVPVA